MHTCRTCLKTPAEKDISELEQGLDEDNKNCFEIMLFCLDIEVAQDSKITTNLCNKCFGKIISFYKFKTLSLKSDAYLKSLDEKYVQESSIKLENTLDPDDFSSNLDNLVDDYDVEIKVDGSNLVEDFNADIKFETGFDNEGTLGNLVTDDEPASGLQNVKYEYIEEEIKENAPVYKKQEPRMSTRRREKTECGPKKMEHGPSNKTKSPRKKRGPKKKSTNHKPERQICDECGMSVLNLKEHSLRHLPKDERKMLKCKVCPKQFFTVGGRNRHYKVTHLGVKAKCDICNKEVTSLSTHKLSVHTPAALRFGCVSCDRRFVSQSALDYHMVVHTKNAPLECDTCHNKFHCKSRLRRHIQVVHEKERKFQCNLCPKAFYHKMRLESHIRLHTNERPFKCEECGKGFRDKKTLADHLLIHSGVKKYRCSVCDVTFQRRNYLYHHMISHTKEKRHPCQYCGVRFGRSDHRRRHEFTAHQKFFSKD